MINTDAHSTDGLDMLEYGVFQARRAGLTAEGVANTWSLERLLARISNRGGLERLGAAGPLLIRHAGCVLQIVTWKTAEMLETWQLLDRWLLIV